MSPEDFSVIDAGWEFRRFLARVAAESSETDWSPEVAGMIGQARVELARSGRTGDLGGAASWGTSNRQVRAALLGLLAGETDAPAAKQLAAAVARLDPTEEDRRQAREALLRLLAGAANDWVIRQLADPVVELATTEDDRRQARELLLGAGRPDRRSGSRGSCGRWLGSTRRGIPYAPGPARRCSGCWPASTPASGWPAN